MSEALTERRAIMELADALNDKRRELLEAIGKLNEGIAALVEHADRLLPETVAEGLGGSKVTKLAYRTHSPSPADIADSVNPKRTVTCSICEKRGHNARSCPNGRKK